MSPPTGPRKRVYNAQERAVINPFKDDFLNAATLAARKAIAQVHIFPALFNYWDSIGITLNDVEMEARSKVSHPYTLVYISRSLNFNVITDSLELVTKCMAYQESTSYETWPISAYRNFMVYATSGCIPRNYLHLEHRLG